MSNKAERELTQWEDDQLEAAEEADYHVVAAERRGGPGYGGGRGRGGGRGGGGRSRGGGHGGDLGGGGGGGRGRGRDVMAAGRLEMAEYENILDNKTNSKEGKEDNALKHFDYYMQVHRKLRVTHKDLEIQDITSDLIGGFITYLWKDAHVYRNPNKGFLKYESATGYASSVKAYFTNKFREHACPPALQDTSWKPMRQDLRKEFLKRVRVDGKALSDPRDPSTPKDRDTTATLCVWEGSTEAAEFFGINTTMFYAAGRGSEVAGSRRKDLSTEQKEEQFISYNRMRHRIQRDKNGVSQTLGMHPHIVSCSVVVFSSCCVMQRCLM